MLKNHIWLIINERELQQEIVMVQIYAAFSCSNLETTF